MTQPRLLADYAAVPTPRERRLARVGNRSAQGDLFAIEPVALADDPEPTAPLTCPVCAGQHPESRCPHGIAPTLETTTMHISTSAQCDENRLTDADRERIRDAVTPFAVRTPNMGTGERYTTAERIAHQAIGCTEHDLRDSELLEIRQIFKPILATTHPRQNGS